ncbi:hypothetical protein GGI42DRAFT_69371 [Trichoderma sp. SZMC 28013]
MKKKDSRNYFWHVFTRICSTAGTIIIIIQEKERFDLDKAKTLPVYPHWETWLWCHGYLALYYVATACFIHVCDFFGTFWDFICSFRLRYLSM